MRIKTGHLLPHIASPSQRGYNVWLRVVVCPVMWTLLAVATFATPQAEQSPPDSRQPQSRQLPTNSRVDMTLQTLRSDRQQEQWSAAFAGFRRLITADPAVLISRPGETRFLPLHQVLGQEFDLLPKDWQAKWLSTTTEAGKIALKSVVQSQEWNELTDIIHRYPGTDACHLAQLMIVQQHLDRGNRLAALHWLGAMNAVSLQPAVRQATKELERRITGKRLEGQSPHLPDALPDKSNDATWRTRWSRPTAVGALLQSQIETAQQEASRTSDGAWNAVVQGQFLYRRTLRGLVSIDRNAGTTNWALRLQPDHLSFLTFQERSQGTSLSNRRQSQTIQQQLIYDGVRNSIAAGNDAIYVVTAQPAPAGLGGPQVGQVNAPDARLVAISREDGRRLWSAGGGGTELPDDNQLANCWFAGPPLIDRELLHCVVQQETELRLVTLQANNGQVVQSTLLAFPEDSIGRHPARRLVAETPVFAGGLILCPTTAGWLIAVDSLTRSVVWAAETGGMPAGEDSGARRNRRLMSRQVSSGQSAHSTVMVLGRTAVMLPWNASRLYLVDVLTGRRLNHIATSSRPRLLAADADGVILADQGTRSIRKVTADSGDTEWERQSTGEHGVPCGPGVLRGTRLILPVSDGSILTLDSNTGQVLDASPEVLKPGQHGMLLGAESENSPGGKEDLFFVGPVETVCLTQRPVEVSPAVTGELVRLQIAAGKFEAAWETLRNLPDDAFDSDADSAATRFEVAFALAVSGKLPSDVDLHEIARSKTDTILARLIEIREELRSGGVAPAIAAIELLAQSELEISRHQYKSTLLPGELLPASSSLSDPKIQPNDAPTPRVSLRTWVTQIIEDTLNKSDEATQQILLESLQDAAVATLLQIHDPAAAEIIRTRLEVMSPGEEAVQLLAHLQSIGPTAGINDTVSEWMAELTDAGTDRAVVRQHFLRALLGSEPEASDNQYQKKWWANWQKTRYTAVPFARPSPSQRRPYRLQKTIPQDPLLQQFEFLIHRSPARLMIREAGPSNRLVWSIPGKFPNRPASSAVPSLDRCGSLLLVSSADGVSAVSVIEERVVWHSEFQAGSPSGAPTGQAAYRTSTRLVNSGDRWVCLHTGQSVDMLDAFTGELLWSLPVTLPNTVFAGQDRVVVYDHTKDQVTTIDRRSGRRVPSLLSVNDMRRMISAVGSAFVLQQSGLAEDGSLELVWQDSVSGDVLRRLTIDRVARVQQDHGSQIIAFCTDGTLVVADLQSGELRNYHWPTQPSDQADANDKTEPATGAWTADSIRFFEDSGFVYLIHQNQASPSRGRIPERQLTPFRQLRVLDRDSGEYLWEISLQDSRTGVVVTDQLTLPFVAVIDQAAAMPGGERDPRVRLRCFNKHHGTMLIDCQLPSRYSYDALRISPTQDQSVSVELHGNHVRFEPAGQPSVVRPNPIPDEEPD